MRVRVKQGAFDRWWLHDVENEALGWSGARWVPCDPNCGVPTGGVQVCNFTTEDEAVRYALERGFTVAVNL